MYELSAVTEKSMNRTDRSSHPLPSSRVTSGLKSLLSTIIQDLLLGNEDTYGSELIQTKQGTEEKRALLEGREADLYKRGFVDKRYIEWLSEMGT